MEEPLIFPRRSFMKNYNIRQRSIDKMEGLVAILGATVSAIGGVTANYIADSDVPKYLVCGGVAIAAAGMIYGTGMSLANLKRKN